jgi:hypothetical protein
MLADDIARGFATELIHYACGKWTGGRDEDDAVYRAVTEDRDRGALQQRYSSCGDLAHWLLYRLGCRSKFINRQEHLGWRVGRNVSKLAFAPPAQDAKPTDLYAAGDVLVIWSNDTATDAHVMVVLHHEGTDLVCGEYGQPGGAVREHELSRPGWVGRRRIRKVLRLMRALEDAERQRLLVEPDYTVLPQAQAYALQHAESEPV